MHELLDGCNCLIIGDVECWLESFVGKEFEDGFDCGHDVTVCGRVDRNGKDVVQIVCIHDKKELLAIQYSCWEVSSAVCVEHSFLLVG